MAEYGGGRDLLWCFVLAGVLVFPQWIVEMEHIWKKRWFGYSLVATAFAVFIWLNWHLPPSGYAVVGMAVVAGIMAIRPEMGGWERSLWFVVLVCFAIIEIRAINQDRKKQNDEFSVIAGGLTTAIGGLQTTIQEGRTHFDTTTSELKSAIDTVTGGESFAFIEFGLPAQAISVKKIGAPPLYDINITLMSGVPIPGFPQNEMRRYESRKYDLGNLQTGTDNSIGDYKLDVVQLGPQFAYFALMKDRAHIELGFKARNGRWYETIWLRNQIDPRFPSIDHWTRALEVYKLVANRKRILYRDVPLGFPVDALKDH